MAAEKNVRVGCAVARYANNLLLACNYADTNVIGRALYRAGSAANACRTGRNPNFPALCSIREMYNLRSYELF